MFQTKLNRRTSGALGIAVVLIVLFLFFVPIVTYSLTLQPVASRVESIPCPGPSVPPGQTCFTIVPYFPTQTIVVGHAPVSYALIGVGAKPFSDYYTVREANSTELFFVKGTSVVAAELLGFPSIEYNPQGVIEIQNVSITRGALGIVNFTAAVENVGSIPLAGVRVGFSIPGNGQNSTQPTGLSLIEQNSTKGGPTWITYAADTDGLCASSLAPGAECKSSFQALNETVTPGQTFGYTVQVAAGLGAQGVVYQHWFQGKWPTKNVTADWVNYFIQEVNANRTGPKLVEDQTLDAFAQTRFNTQVANYNVSNYGFQQDYAKAFPGSALQIGETTLWPGTQLPFEYASFLQESAPGHWSVLTDSSYTRFGYYIGYGPSIVVSQPCSVTEFPGNVNITALLASHGCQFHIEQAVWLVIEVGSCG